MTLLTEADPDQVKRQDTHRFVRADDFFRDFDDNPARQPETLSYHESDQPVEEGSAVFTHGRVFRLDDGSQLLVEFVRPRVWRLRFKRDGEPAFSKYNSRAIVLPTMAELVAKLDAVEGVDWTVRLVDGPVFCLLESVMRPGSDGEKAEVELWIRKSPFQMTAVRRLTANPPVGELPRAQTGDKGRDDAQQPGHSPAVIWRTAVRPLRYRDSVTVLSVEAAAAAQYLGFGEQGGGQLFKDQTTLNYMNFDNMKYQNAHGKGPLDSREPLYHSEPFWTEMGRNPGLRSQLATMVDNYSHICLDIRKTSRKAVRIATRFNEFNCTFLAADSTPELLQCYSSMVGRPRLKPRYALGHHQGCYGFDSRGMVLDCANEYAAADFPLDAIHIDVDLQRAHKTFTIDPVRFPDPEGMFADLRRLGVKCCTNITPYINCEPDTSYTTLNEMLDRGYAVRDLRDPHPAVRGPKHERYQNWDVGREVMIDPAVHKPDYDPPDEEDLGDTYDSGKPYRGGVYYGWGNGAPGHYPNLNDAEVREWWGRQFRYLFECGLEFIWQDMTTPSIAAEYGDVKSFPFRLLLDCDAWPGDSSLAKMRKKAIELWTLYSFNLHKATFHGLEALPSTSPRLAWRRNRRNFIISRGSQTGSQRFAALWTGDNKSSWDFLAISVVQVLALGMSGVPISGQDVGGFECDDRHNDSSARFCADPELLIRWYCAYSLLPWFRNHYTRYRDFINGPKRDTMRKDGKLFQEPYAYRKHWEANRGTLRGRKAMLFHAVLPVCRYFVRLRYSLMQLLYDAMFENVITGMPIARPMILTDDQDASLFSTHKAFNNTQYLVRNDLLVAPCLRPERRRRGRDLVHTVYLPYPDAWFPMNLLPDDALGSALQPALDGGFQHPVDCRIRDDFRGIPSITPMFIRQGAIIPKIETRLSTPDWYPEGVFPRVPRPEANPVTFHVYPGGNRLYKMYLDDGVSVDSEPLREVPGLDESGTRTGDKYCEVHVKQTTFTDAANRLTRVVQVSAPWNGFWESDPASPWLEYMIGDRYTVVFWHTEADWGDKIAVEASCEGVVVEGNNRARATIVTFPTRTAHRVGVTIRLRYPSGLPV